MKTSLTGFSRKAQLVKKSDRYEVYDLALESLVLSMTVLHPDKATTGHAHDDMEEVYLFVEGEGKIRLDSKEENVVAGDIVIVAKKVFHRVVNSGNGDLIFLCVSEKVPR